jgi:hypothetical protein
MLPAWECRLAASIWGDYVVTKYRHCEEATPTKQPTEPMDLSLWINGLLRRSRLAKTDVFS